MIFFFPVHYVLVSCLAKPNQTKPKKTTVSCFPECGKNLQFFTFDLVFLFWSHEDGIITNLLYTQFAQREEWILLCDTHASRLVSSGNMLAATLCYICVGNIDKIVEISSKNVTTEHKGEFYVSLLQVNTCF